MIMHGYADERDGKKDENKAPSTTYPPIFSLTNAEGHLLADFWKGWLPSKREVVSIFSLLTCYIQETVAGELPVMSRSGETPQKKKAGPPMPT
jgi:hypothetical protein